MAWVLGGHEWGGVGGLAVLGATLTQGGCGGSHEKPMFGQMLVGSE